MHRSWLCLAILRVAWLSLSSANEASQALDSDLKTWSRLKRDAGYFTESGQWRGGFYRSVRSTETEQYRCLNRTDTHCTGWKASERSHLKHETGDCRCAVTASPFCERWTCNTWFEYDCGDSENPATCIAKEELNCDCMEAARNERYCWKWRCREDSNILPGGYHEFEDYECVIPDLSEEFCFRWHGNTSSKYVVESSACQCFERGESFCNYWQCRERGVIRCAQSGNGWCRLEIAIGVGGGMGLLVFMIGTSCCFAFCVGKPRVLTVKRIVVCFVIFCLPWFVGVVIWGGIFGFPWVLLMWSVVLVSAIFATKYAQCKRKGMSIELPKIQLPELAIPGTKSNDDSPSDKANDD